MIKMEQDGTLPSLCQPQERHKHWLLYDAVEEYMERVLDDFQSRFLACHQQARKVVFAAVVGFDEECDKEHELECKEEEHEEEHDGECDKEPAVQQVIL